MKYVQAKAPLILCFFLTLSSCGVNQNIGRRPASIKEAIGQEFDLESEFSDYELSLGVELCRQLRRLRTDSIDQLSKFNHNFEAKILSCNGESEDLIVKGRTDLEQEKIIFHFNKPLPMELEHPTDQSGPLSYICAMLFRNNLNKKSYKVSSNENLFISFYRTENEVAASMGLIVNQVLTKAEDYRFYSKKEQYDLLNGHLSSYYRSQPCEENDFKQEFLIKHIE